MSVAGTVPRPSIDGDHYEILVIGGGINGVAVARECARAGKHVLLLEKHDFASGTTSRSTRIIHGGLRYLEHGEIGLVRESLRERNRLLCERPYLVRPMRFVLALPKHSSMSRRGALAIRAGLQLYKWLAPNDLPQSSKQFDKLLDAGDELSFFDYEDAQCEFPERLVAEWLAEAAFAGARVRNHAEVLEVKRSGIVISVRVLDRLRNEEMRVSADRVVNASGPWVDQICSRSSLSTQPLIDGVRGSHILIEKFPGAPQSAVYTEAEDGRPFFVIPWNGQLLVGTTEVRDDGDPSDATASSAEIEYLIRGFNKIFANDPICAEDVTASYSGIRPLPAGTGRDLNAITRRSFIHDHANDGLPGMVSLIGGKLTTAMSLARQCARKMGVEPQQEPHAMIAMGPASGFESTLAQWSRQAAAICGVSEGAARATAEWRGRCALPILRNATLDPTYALPIVDGFDHLVAEALHAIEREFAVTLGDILLRRVPVALTGKWTSEQSAQAAVRIGHALRWPEQRVGEELEAFEEERERLLRPTHVRSRNPLPAEHAA